MRFAALVVVFAFPGLGAAAPSNPELPRDAPLERIVEAREVQFRRPLSFWREGKQEAATRAVLLRVQVRDPFVFMPRGLEPPLFVYGGSVCRVLRSPFPSGEAVLLAAPLAAGEPSTLWIAPVGLEAREVSQKVVRRHRPGAGDVARGRGLHVGQAPKTKERVYENEGELRDEVLGPQGR